MKEGQKEIDVRPKSCDEFMEILKVVKSEEEKVRLTKVMALIKKGFGSDNYNPKAEEVARIQNYLLELVDVVELGLKLSLPTAKRPRILVRDLRNTIATRFRQELEYPSSPPDDREDRILSWIHEMLRASSESDPLESRLRRGLVAVANESDGAIRSNCIYALLDQASKERGKEAKGGEKPTSGTSHKELLQEAVRIVSKKSVDFRTIEAVRRISLPIRMEAEEFRRSASIARQDLVRAEEALRTKESECSRLIQRVAELERTVATSEERVRGLESEVELEKQKSKQLRETLETRHTNKMAGQMGRLSKTLLRDIEEARICLDREEPNTGMALNRLDDIEKTLKVNREG